MKEEKLLTLLQKKKGFFEAILELSEKESHLPLHEWIALLEQKKILLSCVDEIDRALLPYKASFHPISQEISEEIEQVRKVVERILHLDHQNQEKRKQELLAIKNRHE